MKRIIVSLIASASLWSSNTNALDPLPPFTSLCLPTAATGFDFIDDQWKQVTFKTDRFFLKKVTVPDKPEVDWGSAEIEEQLDELDRWRDKYRDCSFNSKTDPERNEYFDEYHDSCVLYKEVDEDEWLGDRCKEMRFKMGPLEDTTRFNCNFYNVEITFLPDGNYLLVTTHGALWDSVERAGSQVMEMGRCSVISQ